MAVNPELASITFDAQHAATAYLTPRGRRKIFRQVHAEFPCERNQIPFRDGHISMRIWGDGDTVLLIHGWSGCQSDMFDFVPYVTARGFRAVTVDLPAHGESSGVTASLDHIAEALLAIADSCGTVHGIIAHSFGCAASTVALTKGLAAEKVVFLAPPDSYEGFARSFAKGRGLDQAQTEQMLEALRGSGVTVSVISAELVKQLDIPGMIIYSNDDEVTPIAFGREIAKAWKNCRFLEVGGLGHRRLLKDIPVIEKAVDFIASVI